MTNIVYLMTAASLVGFFSCKNHRHSEVLLKPLKNYRMDVSERISEVQNFVDAFATAYSNTIKDSLPQFNEWDSLPIGDPFESKITFFISYGEEAFLNIEKGQKELRVVETLGPVQFFLFTGLDIDENMTKPEALKQWYYKYDTTSAIFGSPGGVIDWNGINLRTNDKFFELLDSDLYVFNGMDFLDEKGRTNFQVKGVGFLTSTTGFKNNLSSVNKIAKDVALAHIQSLFLHSDLFNKIFAERALSPLAEVMLKKENEAKSGGQPYPYFEFQQDFSKLLQLAKKYNLDSNYINGMYAYSKEHFFEETLIWKYRSHMGFFWQWTLINLLLLIISIIAVRWERLAKLVKRTIKNVTLGSLVTLANGYVFANLPPRFGFLLSVLPVFLYLLAILILAYSKKKLDFERVQ